MQNRKPGWGWGSEKEGSFPFSQNGHSDGRNHKWEKDKEKNPPLYQAGTKWLAATQLLRKTRSAHVSTQSGVG